VSGAETSPEGVPALELLRITAGYGRTVVLRDLSLDVAPGKVAALLGPNGIGKTTLLRVASGLLTANRGLVRIDGQDVSDRSPHERAKAGLCLIPEGRGIFRNLSVLENLKLDIPPWQRGSQSYDSVFATFPVLAERRHQRAGSMSGGEQQMLALARAYLSSPKIVLLDEVSMGLSPKMVDAVFATMRVLADMGMTLLLVEQYIKRALDIADTIILMEKGSVSFVGSPAEVDEKSLAGHYLGSGGSSPVAADRGAG
jgi:branched-chain amino acid transport system ATP-binding protein